MSQTIHTDILIIGAGLCGLSTAYFLSNADKDVLVAEARNRLGGRIQTLGIDDNRPIEMGATWLGSKHKHLAQLLSDLDIDIFVQEFGSKAIYEPLSTSPPYLATLPPNEEPTFRIKGGSMTLINKLTKKIGADKVKLNTPINKLSFEDNAVVAYSDDTTFLAKKVITTLPPNLLLNKIQFEPQLPQEIISLAKQTHTWMGESIKVALVYDKPFWRTDKSSGTIFSNVGPIPEMYDHSNFEDSFFALKGFLNGAYFDVSKEERLKLVLNQLRKYFGGEANSYKAYHEAVWRKDVFAFHDYDSHVHPHDNNGHPFFAQTYFEDKLLIAGAETAKMFPGYMDGAVSSAQFAAQFALA